MNLKFKRRLGFLATMIASDTLTGKTSPFSNLPPHPMDDFQSQGRYCRWVKNKGSKPTLRRSKIKAARKANVQRLIKYK